MWDQINQKWKNWYFHTNVYFVFNINIVYIYLNQEYIILLIILKVYLVQYVPTSFLSKLVWLLNHLLPNFHLYYDIIGTKCFRKISTVVFKFHYITNLEPNVELLCGSTYFACGFECIFKFIYFLLDCELLVDKDIILVIITLMLSKVLGTK